MTRLSFQTQKIPRSMNSFLNSSRTFMVPIIIKRCKLKGLHYVFSNTEGAFLTPFYRIYYILFPLPCQWFFLIICPIRKLLKSSVYVNYRFRDYQCRRNGILFHTPYFYQRHTEETHHGNPSSSCLW